MLFSNLVSAAAAAATAAPLSLTTHPAHGLPSTYPPARCAFASLAHRSKGSPPLPMPLRRRRAVRPSAVVENSDVGGDGGAGSDLKILLRRFWKIAAPYWSSEDKVQARLRLAAVFALTLGTTGISVGFNFLGRDFYNALASKDQEQFTKQLLYYLGAFAGGIPVFVLRDYARETLSLRWRSWMTRYYMKRYFENQTFYKIQSQSIIDNPDQRIVDDLSAFTGTALSFSLTLFNAAIDLISFSNILFGIYPPLFVVLIVYSLGGTVISVLLGKGLVTLNFMQEKKEADFRYGLVRVRENAESIAFYGGEENEMQLLLQRFRSAFENLSELLISSRNLEFFTNGYRYLIQILPAAVVAPMYFSGKIEFGVINQSVSAFNHILSDFSLIVYQFQAISAFSAVINRLVLAKPLLIQYDKGDPNSVFIWLERWTITRFWYPIGKPKKVIDSKKQKIQINPGMETASGKSRRTIRTNPSSNVGAGQTNTNYEPERTKRNLKKISSSPVETVQEHRQSELERVKSNLRKISTATKDASEQPEVDIQKSDLSLKKDAAIDFSENLSQGIEESVEKQKKDAASLDSLQLNDGSALESLVSEGPADVLDDDKLSDELQLLQQIDGTENTLLINGHLTLKEDQLCHENQKVSKRRASFSAKSEYSENGLPSIPVLPSYMAATESAKAKLKGQISPRLVSESVDKGTHRHSLPSSTNGKMNSPRTKRLTQSSSGGGINREINDRAIRVGWRR